MTQSDAPSGERPVPTLIATLGTDFVVIAGSLSVALERGAFSEFDEVQARSLVRALFAFVEGTSNALKWAVVAKHEMTQQPLPRGMLDALEHRRTEVNEKGQLVTSRLQIPWTNNLKLAFATYASLYSRNNPLDTSVAWWNSLMASATVRDRLIHPKLPVDLDVTIGEVEQCLAAELGFRIVLGRLVGLV